MRFLAVALAHPWAFAAKVGAVHLYHAQDPGIGSWDAEEADKLFHDDGSGRLVSALGSKPAPIPGVPFTEEEQGKALFDGPLKNFTVDPDIGAPTRSGGVVMATYHKTGWRFAELFGRVSGLSSQQYWDRESRTFQHGGSTWDMFFRERLDVPPGRFAMVCSPSVAWPLPPGAPAVHWYRDPVDLVLSGYRYHGNKASAERWEGRAAATPRTDAGAHAAIFSNCGYNCSYFDLLQAASEVQGVVIETLMERQMLQNMVGNLQRLANDPQVLHISMEHLSADYDATVRCVLEFLGMHDTDELFNRLQHLNVHASDVHVTQGKYNNSALRALLEEHDTWGIEFKAIRKLSQRIYNRQKQMFGCPVPL